MLQAGFARVDVTPPLGNPLAGYFNRREADGVLDPIELNALAVSDGENTWRVNTFKSTGTKGRYYVYIDGINLTDMSKPLTFTVYDKDGNQVSDTLTYSVESYAYAKQSASGAIKNLVNAMMNYGDAVKALAAK